MASPHGGHGPSGGRDLDRTPLVLTWEVTQACDLTCDHCRADAQPDRDPAELSTAEGKALLDDIAGFGRPPPILVFSGGDPLKRPDLFELIEHATSLGLPTAVTPAPTPLLDRTAIERFAEAGVRRMALSLDGATAGAHDAFRGEDGSFETIRRAAADANDVGLSLQINTTVTAETVDDLPAIADLVEAVGAVMWEVFFLVPVGRGEALEQLSPAESERVMEWLYRRQRDAPFRVITVEAPHYRRVAMRVEAAESGRAVSVGSTRAGHGFLFVSHAGEVYPSGFLPERVGSVREDDVVSLYRESRALEALRDPDRFEGACGACLYRNLCGGSRSRAFATTGDPLASDPLCPYPTVGVEHGA
ncbi:MAG: radical SAM protein [Halobacteriales archaeon]